MFKQTEYFLESDSVYANQAAVMAMLDLLRLVERPDFKTKTTQALSRHQTKLVRLANSSQVDQSKLKSVLGKLDQTLSELHACQGKLVPELSNNEFLNYIRKHTMCNSGAYYFDAPAYNCWLQQTAKQRMQDLLAWFEAFGFMRAVNDQLLDLTRSSGEECTVVAEHGFYQETLDPQVPNQLIRVAVTERLNVYPKISVGRHGLSVRFFAARFNTRPIQIDTHVKFQLVCCTA